MTTAESIAHFLNWGAVHTPKVFYPYNMIAKIVFEQSVVPRKDSPFAKTVQNTLSKSGKILLQTYKRDTISSGEREIRATVDAEDHAGNVLPRRLRRVAASQISLEQSVNALDMKALQASTSPDKKHLLSVVKVAQLTISNDSNERILALLNG